MDTKISTEITESGKKRLEALNKEINEKILNIIKRSKYAPGDEVIEVTASDIDKVALRLKIIQPQKTQLRQLVLATYFIAGTILILSGFFFDDFNKILNENPTRLMLLATGISLTLISTIMSVYLKQKQNQEKEILDAELEKNKFSEIYSLIQDNSSKKNIANTQYNDLTGTAALDFHGSSIELFEIFKNNKIDTDIYIPYGLSIYYGQDDFFTMSLLAIDKSLNESKNFPNKYKIPVISISIEISKEEFNKIYKRFHIILTRNNFENFEIIKELSISDL